MRLTALWWWIDRWRKSTAYTDLTLEQQGAYRNLLDEAHLRGGAIPNNERILAKACGDARVWRRVRPAVIARFVLTDDGWHNETLDVVLRESQRRAEKQRSYRNRQGNEGGNAAGNGGHNTGGSPDPSPDLSFTSPQPPEGLPDAGTSLSEPTVEAFVALWNTTTTPPLPRCRDLTHKRRRHIRARLTERPLAEWKAVMARIEASDFCRGQAAVGRDREQPWIATIDWLVRSPDTAVKVLEGAYDNRVRRDGGVAPVADLDETARYLSELRSDRL